MACLTIPHTKIAGLAAAIPRNAVSNGDLDLMPEKERDRLVRTTGIETRRVAPADMRASDLCVAAASPLLQELGWDAASIDAVVYVTQTPDLVVPGTATQLQQRLGLGKGVLSIDINQGCAGYVYGLSVLGALVATGGVRRGLLLVGDTITHTLSPTDQSTVPIFSDAGSATALEYDPQALPMHFNLQSDGAGHAAICIPQGSNHLRMEGLDIFNFALAEVAPNIRELLQYAGVEASLVDRFVFHQANLLLNETIRKKLALPAEKVPYTLGEYGNTSCATVPVTLVRKLGPELRAKSRRLVLSGFGVGLSWGSALVETSPLVCPEIVEI